MSLFGRVQICINIWTSTYDIARLNVTLSSRNDDDYRATDVTFKRPNNGDWTMCSCNLQITRINLQRRATYRFHRDPSRNSWLEIVINIDRLDPWAYKYFRQRKKNNEDAHIHRIIQQAAISMDVQRHVNYSNLQTAILRD